MCGRRGLLVHRAYLCLNLSVECKNTEDPDLGELGGTELEEEDMELGLLGSYYVFELV